MKKEFYSNGKLLLTGEYAVLDGALALAVPTRYGQSLSVTEIASPQLRWKSFDKDGAVWFEMTLELADLHKLSKKELSKSEGLNDADVITTLDLGATSKSTAGVLIKILTEAKNINPEFLSTEKGYSIETKLDFRRDWGLGSSSTLINNIAELAEVDAYRLLWNSFSGSGYDIACAQHNTPILYRLPKTVMPNLPEKQNRSRGSRGSSEKENPLRAADDLSKGLKRFSGKDDLLQIPNDLSRIPEVTPIDFAPPFTSNLFFVHLNKKQNSRDGIATYRKSDFDKSLLVKKLSEVTEQLAICQELTRFKLLIDRHEDLISKALNLPTVKESLFPDFDGSIKSLGAWGGDFVLAIGDEDDSPYFKDRRYQTVIPYRDMVLT